MVETHVDPEYMNVLTNTHAHNTRTGRSGQDRKSALEAQLHGVCANACWWLNSLGCMSRVSAHTHPFTHTAHCNTLQHNATHCNTLQHTATHCNHTATYCNRCVSKRMSVPAYNVPTPSAPPQCMSHVSSLTHIHLRTQHTATHRNTLQHTATHCNTRQHTATHGNTRQHAAPHCNAWQLIATHYNSL